MRLKTNTITNLETISITIFTIYMLTASLYVPIFNSLFIQMIILSGILYISIINKVSKKGSYIITTTEIYFALACLATLGSLHTSTYTTGEIGGPIIFVLGILISLLIRSNIENYDFSFFLIKWGGVFIAISVFFSYIFPGLYRSLFLSLFRPVVVERMLYGMERGYYAGFTSNSAFAAGYAINGMGLLCCGWILKGRLKFKKEIFLFLIMLIGLLLTQKRAHLLFFIVSWIFVYIQYSSYGNEKILKVFKIAFLSIFVLGFVGFIVTRTDFGQRLFFRIIQTIHIFLDGGDITSSRTLLYDHAWQLFLEKPIYGIGWGNFSQTVVGTITVHTAMQTHNVYLQLLSETGVIGTLFILLPMFMTYSYTIKTVGIISRDKAHFSEKWILAVLYSLFTQTFFFMYGFTGNTIYDFGFLTMYLLACSIIYSFKKFYKNSQLHGYRMN